MTFVSEWLPSRELLVNLTLRELRTKYKRSVLGWAWSMINPLANMLVYTIVFSFFLRASPLPGVNGLKVYALFLLCGLLPWNFFSASVMGSIGAIIANGPLIRKSYFPRQLLPAATVGAGLITHFIEMGLLFVALVCFGDWQSVTYLPVVLGLTLTLMLFAFGLGLLVSSLNVYFRDIEHFMGIFLLVWFYLTPVIYPPTQVPARYLRVLRLNPMTEMADSFRNVLYYGRLPSPAAYGYFLAWSVAFVVAGWLVFKHLEPGMAEEL